MTPDLDRIDVFDPDVYARGDPARNGLPYGRYAWLREHDPCVRLPCAIPGHEPSAWVVSRFDDVSAVLRDPDRFVSGHGVTMRASHTTVAGDGGKPAMITMDGAAHSRNRRLVNRGFTPAVIRSFETHFRTIAAGVIDRAVALGSFDFVGEIASQLPMHAISDLLGVPEADRPQLARWTNAVSSPTDPDYALPGEDIGDVLGHIWDYGLELAELRRKNPGTDVMSTIVDAADQEALTSDELMGFVFTLAAAGNETTRNSASHALLALFHHPEQMQWLRERADRIPDSAIEEMLRWSTPVVYMRRTAITDVELHDRHIAAGDVVAAFCASANFDPDEFADPQDLRLDRSPNRHVTFAVGPHVCLGAHVARLELRVLFEELIRRTGTLRATGSVEYARDSYLRGVKRLGVQV
ncbi:MAG: Linalool 8-monooxygenase [Actinomycetia bacterium]|nr:Linalool 8-monooxygenase [Actinomycetes bacterium]